MEFLTQFQRNFWIKSEGIPGGTLKEFLEELVRNCWRNSGRTAGGTVEEFMRNIRKILEEFLKELRNIPEGAIKKIKVKFRWSSGGTSQNILDKIQKHCLKNSGGILVAPQD